MTTCRFGSFLRDPRLIPVAPAEGLYVLRKDRCNDVRFARLMGEAWRSLPEEIRRAFVEVTWRPVRESAADRYPGWTVPIPVIAAVTDRSLDPERSALVAWAGRFCDDCSAWDAACIAAAPDDVVRAAVGYELAEACLWPRKAYRRDEATGVWLRDAPAWEDDGTPRPGGEPGFKLMASATDALADRWGFDVQVLWEWTLENEERITAPG